MAPAPSKPPIPFRLIDHNTLKELTKKLEPSSSFANKAGDWRSVASVLGFDIDEINLIFAKQKSDGFCTMELFRIYRSERNGSVEEVIDALETVQNIGALQILQNIYPDICKKYEEMIEAQNEATIPANGDSFSVGNTTDMANTYVKIISPPTDSCRTCRRSPKSSPEIKRPRHGEENSHHDTYELDTRTRWQATACNGNHIDINHQTLPPIQTIRSVPIYPSMQVEYDSIRNDEDIEMLDMNQNKSLINGMIQEMPAPIDMVIARNLMETETVCDLGAEEEVSTTSEEGEGYVQSPHVTTTVNSRIHQVDINNAHKAISPDVRRKDNYYDVKTHTDLQRENPNGIGRDFKYVNPHFHNGGSVTCRMNTGQQYKSADKPPYDTYPRSKPNMSHRKQLFSSPSCPDNMQPGQFKTASRPIHLFITYSYDSRNHIKHVASLAECLKDNGFAVSLDMYEKEFLAIDKTGWLSHMFNQADYILVCISKKYQMDVGGFDFEESTDDHRLNAKFLYKQMEAEYHGNGSKNYRFVPLIFPGSGKENIPIWLQNTLIYRWPEQYKHLMFYLSRPESQMNSMLTDSMRSTSQSVTGGKPTLISRSLSTDSQKEATGPKLETARNKSQSATGGQPTLISRSFSTDSQPEATIPKQRMIHRSKSGNTA